MSQRTVAERERPYGKLFILFAALFALLSFTLVACKSSKNTPSATATQSAASTPTALAFACAPAGSATSLTGAGATFPYPLYSKWIAEYKSVCNVEINYQSIGSGGGIKAITDKTVDYAGSDAIMNADQTAKAEAAGGPIFHIPMTMGGIAVVVNLPGIQPGQLKLTPDVLAKVFLKQIKKWNDAAIAGINPGLTLPDTDIAVAHRSDGSGTTFQFTSYLSKISTDWKSRVGSGATVNWPGDVGGQGNDGVAGLVQQTPRAIGYVEVAYAIKSNMVWAALQNSSGKFVQPTLAGISTAAVGVALPDDMKILLVDSSNPDAYPIAGFSWALVYVNQPDQAKGQTLVNYLWWSIHDGQAFSEALNYGKLPAAAVTKAEAQIKSIKYNGTPILKAP